MIRIEKSDWLSHSFGHIKELSDVLIEPHENLETLNREQRDKLRNTQSLKGDVVRILGHHGRYSLTMRIDGSKGWTLRDSILENHELRDFVRPVSRQLAPIDFLESLAGTPYLWGGLSKNGIDCSGLTQTYFFEVFDKIIPRNSRNQRAECPEKDFSAVQNHDLVFAVGKEAGGHHVGIFLNSRIWHSYTEGGVSCHTVDQFAERFYIQVIGSPLNSQNN